MRRFILSGFLASAIVLGTAGTSGAAPTRGRTEVLTCGDASVTVVVSPGAGIKSWGTDGTTYQLKTYEIRIYTGEFTTEPDDIDPIFEFSQSFGNRNGQGEAMACSDHFYNPDRNTTGFGHVTVTRKS
jgi:hypothetical protein